MSSTKCYTTGKVELLFSKAEHPVIVTADSEVARRGLCEYLAANRGEIERLLVQHGAILFRGFRANGASDVSRCAKALASIPFDYIGGDTPRTYIAADVFTATEYPASETISLHNEMSYLPVWPRRLLFFSLSPPTQGGQTSLASSRDVLRSLPKEVVDKFREKGLTYVRHFHSDIPLGKTWQQTYQTHDRSRLERIIASQGSISTWLPNGVLRVTTKCYALVSHPQTGQEVWFNQAEQWHPSSLEPKTRALLEGLAGQCLPHDCTYGDGESLEEDVLNEIRRVMNECKLLFDWRSQDLLLIDNILIMHGRESYEGDRKTLVYLSAS